jgi:L-alanine-DL-glutamate epimerase-like enolase superfamily enzyme
MPDKGLMRPSQRPGHGLVFKPEAVKEYAVRS